MRVNCLAQKDNAMYPPGLEPRPLDPKPRALTTLELSKRNISLIDPLHDPVTWYGINYAGTQVTQWDFQNKGTRTSPARLSFVLEVPLRNLRPSVINSVPCDRILQRTYFANTTHERLYKIKERKTPQRYD